MSDEPDRPGRNRHSRRCPMPRTVAPRLIGLLGAALMLVGCAAGHPPATSGTFAPAVIAPPTTATAITAPALITPPQWGAAAIPHPLPAARAQPRIHTLTVHHQGLIWRPGADVPSYLRALQQWSRQTKGWIDLPYHYIVSPEGEVYAGRAPGWAGDSNTAYDTQGHLQVMLLGNFEEQRPTPAQWDAAVALLARLMTQHGLQTRDIAAHRHHTDQTVCPGAHLMARFAELQQAVARAASAATTSKPASTPALK